ncbi:phage baseplate assembly protein V [Methylobacterium iners]|uniref:Gp5/Type VI secretion system Vgr protein OB-fold domain-containing protein n=1 Tax=Methylobacterium iners TaxID=418707 RepID=A0ABQ4RT78_9HYPH|nr:phage baseplate assembly protein V [Methylobacterium iners]GJD93358.1 hypothetical protein OCOJLMKI_0551 [Methylobacterium iners]
MSYIGSELRRLRKENVRLNRKLALQRIGGPVAERDEKTRKVRIELGEDPETGEKILGPWTRVQSNSAGAFKTFVLPSIGEQMYLESASGVVGADSVAVFGTFNDTNKHPEQGADEAVLFENGSVRMSVTKDKVVLKHGSQGFELTGDGLQMLGVFKAKGGSRPAHYKGGKDSGGDLAVDGNDQLLV